MDAVASGTLLPFGNLPVNWVGSPMRVPISADQNIKEILSFKSRSTKTVLDIV